MKTSFRTIVLPLLLLAAVAMLFVLLPDAPSGPVHISHFSPLMGLAFVGRTEDMAEMMVALNTAFGTFRDSQDQRIKTLEAHLRDVETAQARGELFAGARSAQPGGRPEARAAFARFARTGDEKAMLEFLPQAAMQTQVDPAGGALIPEEINTEIERIQRDFSPMRQLSRVRTVRTDTPEQLVNLGGVSSGWVGETDSRPETNTDSFGKVAQTMGEIYANPKVTQRELDDSAYNIEELLTTSVGEEFAVQESSSFVSGNGVKKPKGYLTYPTSLLGDATRPIDTLQYVKSGGASGFAASNPADQLIDVTTALRAPYRKGAGWTMNSATAAAVRKFKNSLGDYIWRDGLDLGRPDSLLGFPVSIDEFMPDIAADAFPIAFGNFLRGYLIADHITGTRVLRDPYTNKPWVNFYTTKRVGGGVTNTQAIKLLKIAA
ncbi:MAG: capsid protein [Gemmatimonadetes bacterium]|nr:capsid protein [Gemmatimonadota bacterium]